MKTALQSLFLNSAKLHVVGEELPSIPLDAHIVGQGRDGMTLCLRAPVRAGSAVRLELQGGHVYGVVAQSADSPRGYLTVLSVERVEVVPSGIARLASAVHTEATVRSQWAANPAIA